MLSRHRSCVNNYHWTQIENAYYFNTKANHIYQAISLIDEPKFSSCADYGSRLEPIKLNYTTFFPDLEETQLLASQLQQLKAYLEFNNYAYLS